MKNALDYLFLEWRDKPASFLSYATRSGNKAAEQFITVLHGLHMRVLDNHVEAVITDDDIDEDWQLIDAITTLRPNLPQLVKINSQFTEALKDGQ